MENSSLVSGKATTFPKDQGKIPIMKDGMATCLRCGNVGVKDTFYGKGKQYCSANCVRGLPPPSTSRSVPLFKIPCVNSVNLVTIPSPGQGTPSIRKVKNDISSTMTTPLSTTTATITSSISSSSSSAQSSLSYVTCSVQQPIGQIDVPQETNASLPLKYLQQQQVDQQSPQQAQYQNQLPSQESSTNNCIDTNNCNEIKQAEVKVEKETKPNVSNQKSSHTNSMPSKNTPKYLLNSFNWLTMLEKENDLMAAPVSSFKHCPLADVWNSFVNIGLKVEVKNRDISLPKSAKTKQDFYWIASVVKVAGYFILLRYEGFDNDDSKDFWINIFSNQVHPVGWCAAQSKILIPPNMIADKCNNWKSVLVKRLTGSRTLPENFFDQLKENLKSRFRVGMKLEVVDRRRISAVRVATIDKVIGGRLHLSYEGEDLSDSGFWCHQDSSLIHPIGWAQVVGHELKATAEYARTSLEKTIDKRFDENDAYWSLFPLHRLNSVLNSTEQEQAYRDFQVGMKLEAIDPLNLSTICVATVTKVLRNNYLMVGIDGMMADDGSDWFCYHVSSPNIFPVGFCMLNNIPLTPPRGYPKEFSWFEYLQETKSPAAPVHLFKKEIPNHSLKEGMLIEAVDLMVPRLVCVATITKVVGRLLRIHFNGWDESYDQWCDCESPELYPIGWCQMAGYPLEPPKEPDAPGDSSYVSTYSPTIDGRHKKKNNYKGRHKRRRRGGLSLSSSNDTNNTSHSLEKASTSDPCDINTSLSSVSSSFTCDWASSSNTKEPPLPSSSQSSSHSPPSSTSFCVNESNSSVVVKPSPVQPMVIPSDAINSKLSDDPHQWSVADVCHFLRINDWGSYCQYFSNERIDGSQLLKLTRDDILELTCKKLGPSLKIYALIQSIKGSKKHP